MNKLSLGSVLRMTREKAEETLNLFDYWNIYQVLERVGIANRSIPFQNKYELISQLIRHLWDYRNDDFWNKYKPDEIYFN